jgi:hypothetical protein
MAPSEVSAMKVFLSWSGERSRAVAEALQDWLPDAVPGVDPFLSVDIEKGARWSAEVAKQLEESKVGIICLTPENLDSPWILFEAGALSKTLSDARVCTFLLGLEPSQVRPPLSQFQATRANKEDTRRLVGDINKALGEQGRSEDRVVRGFEKYWNDLEVKLKVVPAAKAAPPRPVEDMVPEILESVRAQAASLESLRAHLARQELDTIGRGVSSLISSLGEKQREALTMHEPPPFPPTARGREWLGVRGKAMAQPPLVEPAPTKGKKDG